jgi:hypothetical protein
MLLRLGEKCLGSDLSSLGAYGQYACFEYSENVFAAVVPIEWMKHRLLVVHRNTLIGYPRIFQIIPGDSPGRFSSSEYNGVLLDIPDLIPLH